MDKKAGVDLNLCLKKRLLLHALGNICSSKLSLSGIHLHANAGGGGVSLFLTKYSHVDVNDEFN